METDKQKTLVQMMEGGADKWPDRPLMWEKKTDKYEASTYAKIRDMVRAFGAGLHQMGLKKGDRVALLSEGRNAWLISELGILYNGAINVPLSVKLEEPRELIFRIKHSGCKFVIVSGNHFAKIKNIIQDISITEKVIVLDKHPEVNSVPKTILFDEVLDNGRTFLDRDFNSFRNVWMDVKESDPCNIVYTSGTTADPKGIILTHRNYTSNVQQSTDMFKIKGWESKSSLLILPWDHSFAHTAGVYTLLYNGASMASVQIGKTPMETLKNIPINIKEFKPTFLLSVPALATNFRKNIEKAIAAKGPKVEKLFQKALDNAYKYNDNGNNRGMGLRIFRWPMKILFDKLIFSKIRENFGGRLEFFVGGGALLDIELQRFFYAIGIPMFQGYGLSEASPVISANVPRKHKMGSSGAVVPYLELKIVDDSGKEMPRGEKGQIIVKGENVMAGYWGNEEATRDTVRDGWLYTGDLGYLGKDGFLYVLGREKSLLISSDGEKYSPEGIEEALAAGSPLFDQVMLYNNQSQYTAALVYPNVEKLKSMAHSLGLDGKTEEGVQKILRLFESAVDEYRDGGAHANIFPGKWLPAAIGILPEGFTEQNKFLNSTLKMVRGKITEHYQSTLDYLYTPEGKKIHNPKNLEIIKKLFQ